MPVEWTRRKGHKSNQEIPFLQEQNSFFLLFPLFICLVLVCYGEGGETMEWVALRDGECLWRYSKHNQTTSWTACSRRLCFEQRTGLNNLQRFLPTSVILWNQAESNFAGSDQTVPGSQRAWWTLFLPPPHEYSYLMQACSNINKNT